MTDKTNQDSNIDLRTELEKYLIHWKWFVLSIALALFTTFLFLRYGTPLYKASTTILIKNKEGGSSELSTFQDLGIIGKSGKNIDNEIEILKSRTIIGEVVNKLQLNFVYSLEGNIKKSEVYDKSPVRIQFLDNSILNNNTLDTIVKVRILSLKKFKLYNADNDLVGIYAFDEPLHSNLLGSFKISSFDITDKNVANNIFIAIKATNKVIDYYREHIKIVPIGEKTTVLKASLTSAVKLKAENILNELIKEYNKQAIDDKNQVYEKTNRFIIKRLSSIGGELAFIDNTVKNFKTKNKLTDIASETKFTLKNSDEIRQRVVQTNTQLNLVKFLNKELSTSLTDLLPANLGLDDPNIAKSIAQYNGLILQRNRLLKSAGEKNILLISLNENIQDVKNALKRSLQNSQKSLMITLNQLDRENNKFNSKVLSIPAKEKEFIDIKRTQEIKAGLYSYLLRKKEETSISMAITVSNAKIIDRAYSPDIPVFPKKGIVLLVGLLMGILIPFLIIYLKNLLDTKVHTRKDIESHTSIPFLGDIPRLAKKEEAILNTGTRSSVGEAFRLMRTNLDFILSSHSDKKSGKTIFITSTTSKEGKSFVSINLATTLALSGKKTLLIGMDTRAPKITEYLDTKETKGVTNFITDKSLTVESLKFTFGKVKNLDIISSGVIPPNPAELLMSPRVATLFDTVKEEYEYIIVDTAPVSLVTDTLLIAKYASVFLYVVRADYLDKRMLSIPQTLYKEKKLPNMAIVLNGTDIKKGYGYGYGYGVKEDKPWYKRKFFGII